MLLPFIKAGFDCGDKAVHVVNPDYIATISAACPPPGLTGSAEKNGQFELRSTPKPT